MLIRREKLFFSEIQGVLSKTGMHHPGRNFTKPTFSRLAFGVDCRVQKLNVDRVKEDAFPR